LFCHWEEQKTQYFTWEIMIRPHSIFFYDDNVSDHQYQTGSLPNHTILHLIYSSDDIKK